jgi:hypothetical protein
VVPPVRVGHPHPHLARGVRRAAAPAPTMAPLRTRLLAALLVLALVAGAAGGDPRRGSLLSFYKPVPANTLGMPGRDAPTAPVAPGAVTPPCRGCSRGVTWHPRHRPRPLCPCVVPTRKPEQRGMTPPKIPKTSLENQPPKLE